MTRFFEIFVARDITTLPNLEGSLRKKEAMRHAKASPEEGWEEDPNLGRNRKNVQGVGSDFGTEK